MNSIPFGLLVFAVAGVALAVVVTALIYYLAAREWKDPRRACYWENVGCMYFIFVAVFAAIGALFLVFFATSPPAHLSTRSPSSVSSSSST